MRRRISRGMEKPRLVWDRPGLGYGEKVRI